MKWNMKYEKGWRKEGDGYRREEYVKVLKRCMDAAKPFQNFQSPEYFDFDWDTSSCLNGAVSGNGPSNGTHPTNHSKKRRLSALSVVWCGLRGALEKEEEKKFAPPPAISFSGGPMNVS